MNRYGMFLLVVCICSSTTLMLGNQGALAHGGEDHGPPEKVVSDRDLSAKASTASGTSNRRGENGRDPSTSGGHHRKDVEKFSSRTEQREQVREIVDSKNRGAAWKITGLALFSLGLIIAYWPRGEDGETS